jgi:hypothetical protein
MHPAAMPGLPDNSAARLDVTGIRDAVNDEDETVVFTVLNDPNGLYTATTGSPFTLTIKNMVSTPAGAAVPLPPVAMPSKQEGY